MRAVLLSASTTVKQAAHHPDMAPPDYARLIGLIDGGEALQHGTSVIFIERGAELPWMAVVKVLAAEAENYLVSFYRIASSRYLARLRRRDGIRTLRE